MIMTLFESKVILLAERIRMGILNCVKYFGIIDSIIPVIPAIFDLI